MLPITNKPLSVGVLSFDTGTINLGCSFSIFHYHTGIQEVIYSQTLQIPRLVKYYNNVNLQEASGDLQSIDMVYNTVLSLCKTYQPEVVVAESSYMSRFPRAYATLTLCLMAIERAAFDYDIDVGYATLTPSVIKNLNGVSGGSGDKEDMRVAVSNNPLIVTTINLDELDEHAIDSIAIAQSYFRLTTYS